MKSDNKRKEKKIGVEGESRESWEMTKNNDKEMKVIDV